MPPPYTPACGALSKRMRGAVYTCSVYAYLHDAMTYNAGGTCQLERKCTSHHQQGRGEHWPLFSRTHSSPHPKKHLGSKHTPILQMEPANIIIDELHLLLRIDDVLLRNVILQADNLDRRSASTELHPHTQGSGTQMWHLLLHR